ncbi:MAG TPA: hypothetical protein VKU02_01975 [Gemmataceae bacterium]|nr:hypothetical protein [Gemmataceae bacterium]
MNRTIFLSALLVLASTAMLAVAADQAVEKPVVVDPMDLRTPVPDPEQGLTEKYDGKIVVFAGNLYGTGQDPSTKQRWYKLAVQVAREQSSPAAKPKMQTVVVNVYFAGTERNLPTRPAYYTVQGKGEIRVDGSLVIHDARTVSVHQKKSGTGRS